MCHHGIEGHALTGVNFSFSTIHMPMHGYLYTLT